MGNVSRKLTLLRGYIVSTSPFVCYNRFMTKFERPKVKIILETTFEGITPAEIDSEYQRDLENLAVSTFQALLDQLPMKILEQLPQEINLLISYVDGNEPAVLDLYGQDIVEATNLLKKLPQLYSAGIQSPNEASGRDFVRIGNNADEAYFRLTVNTTSAARPGETPFLRPWEIPSRVHQKPIFIQHEFTHIAEQLLGAFLSGALRHQEISSGRSHRWLFPYFIMEGIAVSMQQAENLIILFPLNENARNSLSNLEELKLNLLDSLVSFNPNNWDRIWNFYKNAPLVLLAIISIRNPDASDLIRNILSSAKDARDLESAPVMQINTQLWKEISEIIDVYTSHLRDHFTNLSIQIAEAYKAKKASETIDATLQANAEILLRVCNWEGDFESLVVEISRISLELFSIVPQMPDTKGTHYLIPALETGVTLDDLRKN